VLPLQFHEGQGVRQLGLSGEELFDVVGIEAIGRGEIPKEVTVRAGATEFAARRGLRVVAVTRPENFDYVRQLGAADVVDYASGDVAEVLRSRYPAGLAGVVDLFHDAAGLAPFASAVRPDGWLVSTLARGAEELLAGAAVHVHLTGIPYQRLPEVVGLLAQAPTGVAVEVLPLDRASDALARQATRQVRGKLALGIAQTEGDR